MNSHVAEAPLYPLLNETFKAAWLTEKEVYRTMTESARKIEKSVFAKPNQTKGLMFNDLFKFENERD
jgi:hypothetical protein